MENLNSKRLLRCIQSKSNFQNHPFHLVSPSPWPILTSISLFILTTSTVCFMHGFQGFENLVPIAIINVAYVMGLWFRDIISEGNCNSLASVWVVVDVCPLLWVVVWVGVIIKI